MASPQVPEIGMYSKCSAIVITEPRCSGATKGIRRIDFLAMGQRPPRKTLANIVALLGRAGGLNWHVRPTSRHEEVSG